MGERILIPVSNFSPWSRAITRTLVRIENSADVSVLLLHVFDTETRRTVVKENTEDDTLDALAASRSGVRAASDVLSDADITHEIRGFEAPDLGPAILDVVVDEDVDRIYMYNRKRSPAGKAVFGSTIAYVLSNATVPVVVLPDDATYGEKG